MKHSPFILVNHEIRQTYEPVGDSQFVMDGLEDAAKLCQQTHDFMQHAGNAAQYEEWLNQIRHPAFMDGLKRCVLRHPAHLMMLELVSEEELAEHPAGWLKLRSALMTEAAILRQQVSPIPGENIVH